jgi:hypothetical protein
MPKAKPPDKPGLTEEECDYPIVWFFRMVDASEKGFFDLAAEAQHALDRLGWRVDRKPRRKRAKAAGKAVTE